MPKLSRLLIASLAVIAASCAHAQSSYPTKPIRMIVSIASGSVTDVIMRAAATELQPRLGQPLVIENKGGASGIPAGQACAQATPDGYTICVIYHSTLSYNPLLFSKLPYDAERDFVPITRLFFLTEGVFVSTPTNLNTVAEFKAHAQANPAALNFATLGDGSFPDLFLKWLNNQWGTKIVGVPYRGGGPAAQALAANEVQVTRFGVGNFLGLVEAGRVKALAVSSAQRSPLLPDAPTFEEAGWGGYPGQGWWGLAAPKGTPADIVSRLNAEFSRLFSEPKFVDFLEKQAVTGAPTTPQGFLEFLQQDRKAAQTLIAIANTRVTEYKPE